MNKHRENNIGKEIECFRKELQQSSVEMKDWSLNYFDSHWKRYEYELRYLKGVRPDNVLEIGSLPLHMSILMKKLGIRVRGIDIDPGRSASLINQYQLQVDQCDIETEQFPYGDDQFDLALFTEVFEHLRIDPVFTLSEIYRVIKPGGRLILSTPNLYAYFNIVNYMKGRAFDNPLQEFQKLHSIGHMGHVRLYSSEQLRAFLKHTGFGKIHIEFNCFERVQGKLAFVNILYRMFPKIKPYIYVFAIK